MKKKRKIIESEIPSHPAVKAWSKIRTNQGEIEKIQIIAKKREGSVYRLVETGPNSSTVIAKRCISGKAAIERIVYEEIFPTQSVSLPLFYGYTKEEDGLFWWLFLEDVGDQRLSPTLQEHRAIAARWMGEMNTNIEMSNVSSALPNRGPEYYQRYLGSIREILPNIKAFDKSGIDNQKNQIDILSMCETLEERWTQVESYCSSIPRTLVHGDCQVKNAHVRAIESGLELAPFDWASAGWGLPATDLGQLGLPYKSLPRTDPDCETYLSIIHEIWPELDLKTIQQLANLGQIFWSLKVISKSLPEFDAKGTYLDGLYYNYQVYATVLSNAIRVSEWVN
jgi:thiamine kinase-like enzyme